MKSVDDEFRYSFIQNSNIQKPYIYNVHNLFINRDAGLASNTLLDAVRKNDPRGDVSVPNHSLHAQHCHYHLQYFYQPTAKPNLVATAETVRSREKSFNSPISRLQIPEQPHRYE